MIVVETVKLNNPQSKLNILKASSSAISDTLRIPITNKLAEEFAEKITLEVKDLKCVDHPDVTSFLKIKADKEKGIVVDKSGFCCTKFADSVSITVKN